MKIIYQSLFSIMLLGASSAFAQSSFKQVTYKQTLRPALYLPLSNRTEIAEQTILNKLKETGYKPQSKGNIFRKSNKQEGYYAFSGVQVPELANQKLDLYFKVDPLNGDNSYNSAISLMVSKGYDNFVSPETDSATFGAAERFLNTFVSETAEFNLNKELEDQKNKLASSEKKWQDLRNKQQDAQKKISQLQAEVKTLQDQERSQQQDVETLRAGVQDLEAKRTATTR